MVLWKGVDITLNGNVSLDASGNIVFPGLAGVGGSVIFHVDPRQVSMIRLTGSTINCGVSTSFQNDTGFLSSCASSGFGTIDVLDNLVVEFDSVLKEVRIIKNGMVVSTSSCDPVVLQSVAVKFNSVQQFGGGLPAETVLTNVEVIGGSGGGSKVLMYGIGGLVLLGGLYWIIAGKKKKK